MLVVIFQEWLQSFYRQVIKKLGRNHVLLLIGNYTSHKLGNMGRYSLLTTLKLQPMDVEIIMPSRDIIVITKSVSYKTVTIIIYQSILTIVSLVDIAQVEDVGVKMDIL